MSQKKAKTEIRKIVQKLQKEDTEQMLENDAEFDKIVLGYLRDNKLIVTGQRALEALLPKSVQPDPTKNHFELISDHPHKHRNEIADLLEANGYIDVQRLTLGKNPTINVKHRLRVKFYYAKPQLFSTIDTRQVDGVNYESEIMLKIKVYSKFTNPSSSITEWKELYPINIELNKKFNIETGDRKCFVPHEKFPSEKEDPEYYKVKKLVLDKFMMGNQNIIIVGQKGYQMLVKESGILSKKDSRIYYSDQIRYFEVISLNVKDDIDKIKDLLKQAKLDSGFSVRQSGSTLDYHGPKWSIYHHRHKIIDFYDSKNECIPFTLIDGLTIGSFHLVLKYLYIGLWVAKKQINSKLLEQKNMCLIDHLIRSREYYLTTKKQLGIEMGPFKIFHTICLGTREDIILQRFENTWEYLAKKFSRKDRQDKKEIKEESSESEN